MSVRALSLANRLPRCSLLAPASPSLPPSASPSPPLPSPRPVLPGNSGRRGGRLPARSLARPAGSLPPASVPQIPRLRAEPRFGRKKRERTPRVFGVGCCCRCFFFFFLLVINPDEVSCLRFPFRAVVFLARDECFGGPRPLVFWGGLACKGAGVLNTFGNYSFLVVVEGVGQPRALPLLIPRRWADGGTGIWGSRGWERGVRLHLRCLSACGDSGHLDRTAQASEEEVAGFLVATVFVFWALRDSVLAPDGCSLLFLNSILLYFFFSRGASSVLKKKKK